MRPDPDLTPAAIAALCRNPGAVAIDVVERTGSTNADLLARSAAGSLAGPQLLVALQQTAGRGRAGRQWQSDGASLTFSLAWPFARPLAGLVGLPLAVGVALAEVLRAQGAAVGLKWPNDVLLEGRKLAGILIETAGAAVPGDDPAIARTWAVIGIGINIAQAHCAATAEATVAAGQDTSSTAPAMPIALLAATDRSRLLARLIDALAPCLQAFDADGFAPFARRWNTLHAWRDRAVQVVDGARTLHAGRALGVDPSGRLVIETAAGTVAVMAGDVSLRVVAEST